MSLQQQQPAAPNNRQMASSRRSDYGEEFVERLRKDRFRKGYILVNGVSSEEDEEELCCFEDEDDEIASYAMDPPPPRPSSTHSSRRPPSVTASFSQRQRGRAGAAYGFDARDLYFFGVISELTDEFTAERATRLIAKNPPPPEYRSLVSIERIAYLLYYSLYGRYLTVNKFHHVFNREFYKYTSAGDSERIAFLKICRHTLEEYKRRALEQSKRAYKLSQKHLFSDERATPDSRLSDRPSMASEDLNSIDSLAKELMFYRSPHTPVRFAPGGRIIYVDPDSGVSSVSIEDVKRFYKDAESRRYVEMLESFKGPMIVGHTPPQTPLLFIQCQIDRIIQSDVYRANPSSGDANDCLLIWYLLEMLIRQHGKVTGPDLARLLCSDKHYSMPSRQSFLKSNTNLRNQAATKRQDSSDGESTREADPSSMDRVTRFLLGGHIDEAIESAINDGFLFDALLLAHRLFRGDQRRIEAVEARLLAYKSPQHPVTTLLSVAADQPVPLLNNPTTHDTNGWRSHIAIVLANLQSQTAMSAVYHLGVALAQKEFNSAADFCFLAVNLLAEHNCFQQPSKSSEHHGNTNAQRKFIQLINASLPDDEANSCMSRFGWSILDYQATELYDYALQLSNPNKPSVLSNSYHYNCAKQQYAQLLDELGGFSSAVELYRAGKKPCDRPKTPLSPLHSSITPLASLPDHQSSQIQATRPISPEPFNNSSKASRIMQKPRQPQQMQANMSTGSAWTAAAQPWAAPQNLPPPIGRSSTTFEAEQQQEYSYSRSPSPATLTHSPPISSNFNAHLRRTSASERYFRNDDGGGGVSVDEFQMQSNIPSFPLPTPPFFNVGGQMGGPSSINVTNMQPEMEGVNVDADRQMDLRRDSISSMSNKGAANIVSAGPSGGAATSRNNSARPPAEPKKSHANEKGDGGQNKGFLRGFLSKIKPPTGPNEMKLPEDRNPKIVWDSQLGRYVDQEHKDQPQEELAPPPTIPTYQQSAHQPIEQQQRPGPSISPVAEQQSVQPVAFPQMPALVGPPQPAPNTGRPFQGKARYANAWN